MTQELYTSGHTVIQKPHAHTVKRYRVKENKDNECPYNRMRRNDVILETKNHKSSESD